MAINISTKDTLIKNVAGLKVYCWIGLTIILTQPPFCNRPLEFGVNEFERRNGDCPVAWVLGLFNIRATLVDWI